MVASHGRKCLSEAYQSANLAHAGVGSLVGGHALDAALLDAELASEAVQLVVPAVAGDELVLMHGTAFGIANRNIGGALFGVLLRRSRLYVCLVEGTHGRMDEED